MKDLININRLNRFGQNIWTKIKNTFMTKEDAINGILVGQEWTLLESVVGNSPIVLPSTDSFSELYIEMYSSNGTISHQQNIRLDSILFESSNNEYREILLDSVYDAQTYVKYNFATNSIIPIMYEGNEITDSSNITTRVYTKTNNLEVGNIEAEKIVYDNSVSGTNTDNVQGAIDEVVRTLGYTVTSKNLLPNITKSVAKLGLTFTYNSDRTVTVNGTATEDYWYDLCHRITSPITLKKNSYVLSGCANGGSDSGYYMAVTKTVNGSGEEIAKDYGNGVSFTLNEDTNVGAFIYIKKGTTVNNLTFYPMIRYASIEDNTYESYVPSVKSLICDIEKISINQAFTSTAEITEYWSYTAEKRCLINISVTFGNYEGGPKDVKAYIQGRDNAFVNYRNTGDGQSHMCIPINICLEKGEKLQLYALYSKVGFNRFFVEGYVQYLE